MDIDEKKKRLQDILLLARKSLGWTAKEFGDKLDVSRQTINNLEAHRANYNLTTMQYLAMRQVFQEEINEHPDKTEMLKDLLAAFVDHPEAFTDEQRKEIKNKANMLAPAILSRSADKHDVYKVWTTMLAAAGIVIGAAITAFVATNAGGKKK